MATASTALVPATARPRSARPADGTSLFDDLVDDNDLVDAAAATAGVRGRAV